jgi:MGT family glycosyltransferase
MFNRSETFTYLLKIKIMKILMINLPFFGHTNPTLPLTEKLIQRGHTVVYINAEQFREAIEKTGAKFIPYKDYPTNPSEKEKKKLCFMAAYHTALSMTETFDLLIYEMFFYPGIEIAKRKHIPCVRQFSQSAWSDETFKDTTFIFKMSAKLIDIQVLPKSKTEKLGFENHCLIDGILKSKPELNIVYVPDSFQNKRESFDETYLFIVPKPEIQKSDIVIPYEKMKHPIIYISLGSIISNKNFCMKCIKSFGDTEFSVILNIAKVPIESLGKIPENVYVYNYVPQIEVLTHTDVFLTHCGMNSVNEALWYGVPMVAMPIINDQLENGKRIEALGIGKKIRAVMNSGTNLYKAACEVYANKEMKKKAVEISEKLKKQISMDEVVDRIEQIK